MSKSEKTNLDDRDYKLINILIENPRASLSSIAKELEISVTAVSKRLKKLENEDFIKYKVAINLNKYNVAHSMMLVETQDSKSRAEIIQKFSSCPIVDNIFDIIGWEFHLLLCLVSPDQRLLNNFMTYCPINFLPGIKRSITLPTMLNNFKPTFIPVSFNNSKGCGTVCANQCERYGKECPGCPAQDFIETEEDLVELAVESN